MNVLNVKVKKLIRMFFENKFGAVSLYIRPIIFILRLNRWEPYGPINFWRNNILAWFCKFSSFIKKEGPFGAVKGPFYLQFHCFQNTLSMPLGRSYKWIPVLVRRTFPNIHLSRLEEEYEFLLRKVLYFFFTWINGYTWSN